MNLSWDDIRRFAKIAGFEAAREVKARQRLDDAVMKLCGFSRDMTEAGIVTAPMESYRNFWLRRGKI